MFKNAFLSIKKSIGKTILLFIIMGVIANLVIAGLAIRNATEKSMEQIRASLGNDVTLSVDMRSLMGNRDKGQAFNEIMPTIDTEMADQIKDLEYVDHYNYMLSVGVYSDDIEPVEMTKNEDDSQGGGIGGFGGMKRPAMNMSDFSISGQTSMAYISEFVEEQYVLTEGKLLSEEDNGTKLCVIESQLALDNDLSIGDKFKVYASEDKTYELEVAGIFEVQSENDLDKMFMGGMGMSTPYNKIYTSLDFAQDIKGTNELSSAVYYLDDPENIEAFIELAKDNTNIDFDIYTLNANDFAYERSVSFLQNMESFTTLFLVVVIVAGCAILCLILILTLRSRFYEFGVLLSLGQSKIKIIGQQFIEVMIVAALALCLSIGTGKIVANGVSGLLQSASTPQNNMMMEMPQGGMPMPGDSGESGRPPERPGREFFDNAFKAPENKELDVSLDFKSILQLAGISTGICMVSILLPSLYVLRLSPREILIKKEG